MEKVNFILELLSDGGAAATEVRAPGLASRVDVGLRPFLRRLLPLGQHALITGLQKQEQHMTPILKKGQQQTQ